MSSHRPCSFRTKTILCCTFLDMCSWSRSCPTTGCIWEAISPWGIWSTSGVSRRRLEDWFWGYGLVWCVGFSIWGWGRCCLSLGVGWLLLWSSRNDQLSNTFILLSINQAFIFILLVQINDHYLSLLYKKKLLKLSINQSIWAIIANFP